MENIVRVVVGERDWSKERLAGCRKEGRDWQGIDVPNSTGKRRDY